MRRRAATTAAPSRAPTARPRPGAMRRAAADGRATRRSRTLLARSQQRRRQRHELRPRQLRVTGSIMRPPLKIRAPFRWTCDVAAGALDVEREQVVGAGCSRSRRKRARYQTLPAKRGTRHRPVVGQRDPGRGLACGGTRRSPLTTDVASSMTRVPASRANAGAPAAASSAASRRASQARANRSGERRKEGCPASAPIVREGIAAPAAGNGRSQVRFWPAACRPHRDRNELRPACAFGARPRLWPGGRRPSACRSRAPAPARRSHPGDRRFRSR